MQEVFNAAQTFPDVLKNYIETEEKRSRIYDSEGYELRKAHVEIVGVCYLFLKANIKLLEEAMKDRLTLDD